ncbi:MAG: LamG domain-containing protein, partial [Thermoguttaceae bacterium]|nr:LamG domain-containing protein [Thermoguttaceae bacterium]
MKKILFPILTFLFLSLAVPSECFPQVQTPDDWTTLKDAKAWTIPREHTRLLKISTGKEFILLDASALSQTPAFSNIQLNVPGIDVKSAENRTFFFTLDVEGTKDTPVNVYLEGRNSDGKFLAVHLKRGGRFSGTLSGKRQKMFFLAFIPKGVQELHWRFDFFKAGLFRLYGVKTRFLPTQDPTEEMKLEPELIFHLPFDGNTEPKTAFGEKKPLESRNVDFVPGLSGQAANFTRKRSPALRYALEKNLDPQRGTISVWVKGDSADAGWRTMLTMPWNAETRIGSGAVWFWLWCGKLRCDTSDVMDQSITSVPLDLEEWTHLVFSWDPFRMRAFVNGKLVAGGVPPEKRLEPFMPFLYDRLDYAEFHVGNYFGNALEGAMDELKIFSAPLSEREVLALYQQFRPLSLALDELYFFDDETSCV